MSHPVFLSRGGAGGASLKEGPSYLINPASMAFQQNSRMTVAYSFKKKHKMALISFLDKKTNLPLALSYSRFWSKSFSKKDKATVLASSGFKILPLWSIGLSLEKELKKSVWRGGLGTVLNAENLFSVAALWSPSWIKKRKQSSFTFSAYHQLKGIAFFQLDAVKPPGQKWIFRGGVESAFHNYFSLRAGGAWFQETKEQRLSGGLAFLSPRFALEYGLEKSGAHYQHALVFTVKI